jgi:alkylation response protein AidB-like acyl-CoA dehydrogenase
VLEAARQLAPMVRENAEQIDADRELPKPVFRALADAGLYLMGVPRAVGGLEIDFPTYVQVIEEIAKADASTAWTVSQGANWGTYSGSTRHAASSRILQPPPRRPQWCREAFASPAASLSAPAANTLRG